MSCPTLTGFWTTQLLLVFSGADPRCPAQVVPEEGQTVRRPQSGASGAGTTLQDTSPGLCRKSLPKGPSTTTCFSQPSDGQTGTLQQSAMLPA